MKRLLAIETSAEACSAALVVDGEVRERFEHAPLKHAERILPMISGLLAEAGLRAADLEAIAFGRGPGSFTSLRIGIGVVQGLAWGADRPVAPVSSLQAVAQAALDASDAADDVLVAMDARMDEVFHGAFRRDGHGIAAPAGPERVGEPASLAAPGGGPFIAAGNGFARYEGLSALAEKAAECLPDLWPRAAVVLRLAEHWLAHNAALSPERAQPVYIRNTVAEKPGGG